MALEDRVEQIEHDMDQMHRIVQMLDEPGGSTDTSEIEEKINEISVDYDGLDARNDILAARLKKLEARVSELTELVTTALTGNATSTTPAPAASSPAQHRTAGADTQ